MSQETLYLDLIAKYLSRNASTVEARALMAWVEATPENRLLFDEMARVWELSGAVPDPVFPGNPARAWDRLDALLDIENGVAGVKPPFFEAPQEDRGGAEPPIIPISRPKRLRPRRWWAAAASIAFLLLAAWWQISRQGTSREEKDWIAVQTASGERQEVALPDGSTVWLNENTTLTYARNFLKRREVKLQGEAFFSVARLEKLPFTIFSKNLETTVLGTTFNVRAYPGEQQVEVSVSTGTVQVDLHATRKIKSPVQQSVTVGAGRSAVFLEGKEHIELVPVPTVNASAWKDEQLIFDSTPMPDLIAALERYFDIEIEVLNPDLMNCTFHGSFVKPDIEEVLNVLKISMDLEIEVRDGVYEFFGNGCE
ncbi:MAG: FecR domain-containing protein [Haliscomenobacter sp.]|nr:FecR domain-containing protein [Haliscomenobacter sp.]